MPTMQAADHLDLKQWAERRTAELAGEIKALIDCGMDYESAIDSVFDNSILADGYKMKALELVGPYHHVHKFVKDIITGREWCATCQTFKE